MKKRKLILLFVTMSLLCFLGINISQSYAFFYITKTYNVFVDDQFERAVSGTTVKLKRGSSTIITGVTDGNGFCSITARVNLFLSYKIQALKTGYITQEKGVSSLPFPNPCPVYIELPKDKVRLAVIVGITDYDHGDDIDYGHNDASDWYNHLINIDFDWIRVLGDETSEYSHKDGIATEVAVKQALNTMISYTDGNDLIVFTFSGHGQEPPVLVDEYALQMWDASDSPTEGYLNVSELVNILETTSLGTKIFVFLDSCYSGGFGDNIYGVDLMHMSRTYFTYLTTTCNPDGGGYPDHVHLNGKWTYYFLEHTWIGMYGSSTSIPMETIYQTAANERGLFPFQIDYPQEYDREQDLFYIYL